MANVTGLHRTLAFIEMNPAFWDQSSWLHCFAAIAVELAGHLALSSLWVRLPGRSVQVWDAAAEVLDLARDQARALFDPGHLRALVDEILQPHRAPLHARRGRHARHPRSVG